MNSNRQYHQFPLHRNEAIEGKNISTRKPSSWEKIERFRQSLFLPSWMLPAHPLDEATAHNISSQMVVWHKALVSSRANTEEDYYGRLCFTYWVDLSGMPDQAFATAPEKEYGVFDYRSLYYDVRVYAVDGVTDISDFCRVSECNKSGTNRPHAINIRVPMDALLVNHSYKDKDEFAEMVKKYNFVPKVGIDVIAFDRNMVEKALNVAKSNIDLYIDTRLHGGDRDDRSFEPFPTVNVQGDAVDKTCVTGAKEVYVEQKSYNGPQ